jgi:hypothetical protein
MHVYEVGPRYDHRGVDLISDGAPVRSAVVRRAERNQPRNRYAMHRSRSHDAVIRVYDAAGNVIETDEHKGEFKECS